MIELTKRDLLLVEFLANQGFATFSQIQKHYFPDKHSTSRRLSILTEHKIVKKQSINDIFDHSGRYFPVILQMKISPKQSIYSLGDAMTRTHAKALSMQKANMLLHQLFLNNVLMFIKKEFPSDVNILTEQEIKEQAADNLGRKKLAPDLSVEMGRTKIAVELERTIKSKTRYQNKIYQFDRTIYSHIWFVVLNDKHLRLLRKKIPSDYKYGFSHIRDLETVISREFGTFNIMDWVDKVKTQTSSSLESPTNNSFAATLHRLRLKDGEG